MKKIFLFSAVICSVAFYACKKEVNNITNTLPAEYDTTYTQAGPAIDPVTLAAATTAAHGATVTGQMPASSGTALALEEDGFNNLTYYAINNRYVVIYPRVSRGSVAGYYVQINGAPSHIKITYPEVVAPAGRIKVGNGINLRPYSADSAIIIKLPAGLKGDTFSVKYAAFDKENHVSNVLSAYVKVINRSAADDAKLVGNWRMTAIGEGGNWMTIPEGDSTYTNFECEDGHLVECSTGNCTYNYLSSIQGGKSYFSFATGNKFSMWGRSMYQFVDLEKSPCAGPLVYKTENDSMINFIGGYSYNDSTKIISVVVDNEGINFNNGYSDASNLNILPLKVKELTATTLKVDISEENSPNRAGRDRDVRPYYFLLTKE